jgi:hypothetical protein
MELQDSVRDADLSRDNLDENAGDDQNLKWRPVATS